MRQEALYRFWRASVILAAAIIAAGVSAAIFTLFDAELRVFPIAFVIFAIVAAILGIPTYLALRAAGRVNWKAAAVGGFAVGAVIPALLILLSPSDQASVAGVPTVVDGAHTATAWIQNIAAVGSLSLLGAIGGLSFYFCVTGSRGQEPRETGGGHFALERGGAVIAAALGVVLLAFSVAEASKDRSCHNPLRDGRESIAPMADLELKVGADQWQQVERTVHAFGAERGWAIHSDIRPDDDFQWFQMSLCREPGTHIGVQGHADMGKVTIWVFQPQGGDSWREPFAAIVSRLEKNWPDAIKSGSPTDRQAR